MIYLLSKLFLYNQPIECFFYIFPLSTSINIFYSHRESYNENGKLNVDVFWMFHYNETVVLSWARVSVQLRPAIGRLYISNRGSDLSRDKLDRLVNPQTMSSDGKGNVSHRVDEKFSLRRNCSAVAARFNSKIIDAWKFINFIRLTPPVNSAVDEKFRAFTFSTERPVLISRAATA